VKVQFSIQGFRLWWIGIGILFALSSPALSQDLEELAQKKNADPLQVSGSLSVTGAAASAYGMDTRRPPFYWALRGNLNLRLFDVIDAPMSITYSPQGNNLAYPFQRLQPFNQVGISPSYKSITLHLGYRSMNISRYSLSGNNFNGVGVERKPAGVPWRYRRCMDVLRKL
jgi:hypothetical protein